METCSDIMIALLGPNGSGKTTLLRAICGELSHSGHVLLNGQDLTALSPKALAGLVSYIPQQSGISISMSALDVVLMGFYSRLKLFEQPSAKMRETALQALASVGMDDFANRDYLTLSGGEQQLVILARTLIEDTSLLLFDEPDSSLDFGNKYRMMGLIADIVQAAQGGRSASPAFFPYKKEPVSTHSHTGPDCLQQSHSLRECTSLACSADEPDGLSYSTGKILSEKACSMTETGSVFGCSVWISVPSFRSSRISQYASASVGSWRQRIAVFSVRIFPVE